MANPILSEIYDIRRQILAEHKDDLQDYLHAEFERAKVDGHPIAKIRQRTIRCTGAAKSGVAAVESQTSPPGDR
jgi:hypothetical protein